MTQTAFVLVFLIVVGIVAVTAAYTADRRDRKHMGRRIALVADGAAHSARLATTPQLWDRLAQFDDAVRRVFSFGMPRTWAMTANTLVLSASAGGIGTAVWFMSRYMVGLSPLLALLSAAAAFVMAPRSILSRQQRRAETAFVEAFPDALDSVTRMLQAGMPIASALRAVGNETMPPVNAIFNDIADQTNIGVSISDALDGSSRRIGLPDYRFFAVAIVLQSTTGGNMVSTLERLSEIIRKRRAVRKKAKAVTAEVRFAAYILGALPFLTVGALLVIQPDYLNILFSDPRGHVVLWIAGSLLFLAAFSIRTMMGSVNNV